MNEDPKDKIDAGEEPALPQKKSTHHPEMYADPTKLPLVVPLVPKTPGPHSH